MSLIADSGALYALYDRRDRHHSAAIKTIKVHKGSIIVPAAILSEIDYLLRENLGIDAELDFIDGISSGIYTLEQFTAKDVTRSRELISIYRNLDLGIADAAVIATAERLGIRRVFTVDEKDFRAVRPAHGEFIILPADL